VICSLVQQSSCSTCDRPLPKDKKRSPLTLNSEFKEAIAPYPKIKSDRLYETNYNGIAPYPKIKSDRGFSLINK
jgi:hypothetical protein